jgi:hypothetical protein
MALPAKEDKPASSAIKARVSVRIGTGQTVAINRRSRRKKAFATNQRRGRGVLTWINAASWRRDEGAKFGPMVIPRDPESSNLMLLLDWRASPQLRMPHGKKKLSICDRDAVRTWIREGALNN